jgi:hypothetical protein
MAAMVKEREQIVDLTYFFIRRPTDPYYLTAIDGIVLILFVLINVYLYYSILVESNQSIVLHDGVKGVEKGGAFTRF